MGKQLTNGYDISKWQAGMNVNSVAADFTIIKASEGVSGKDKKFEEFAAALTKAGRPFGAYHFATGKTTGAREAEWFVKCLGNYVGKIALWLDWEGNAESKGTKYAEEFCDTVVKLTGIKPGIYMNANCLKVYSWNNFAKKYSNLWLAQYASTNTQNGYKSDTPWHNVKNFKGFTLAIHQYSSKGKLKNWSGNLDLDKGFITLEDWNKLAGIKEETPAKVYTVDEVANLIVSGAKGWTATGDARKKLVESVGLNYTEVQAKINEIIKSKNAAKTTTTTAAKTNTSTTSQKTTTTSSSSSPLYYKVKTRDTLSKIANTYKTTVAEIMRLNPSITNPSKIYVGQRIRIK